jgi:Bacteriophage Mu Gam like protein.
VNTLEDMLLGEYESPQEIPEEWLTEDEPPQEVRERFRLQNVSMANWALRKIYRIRQRRAEVRAAALREIDKIERWWQGQDKTLEREERFFTMLLKLYHMEQLRVDPWAKTLKFPEGELQFRKQQNKFMYEEPELLAWLTGNAPEYVQVIQRPAWGELKKALIVDGDKAFFKRTGEEVPVKVVPQPPRFAVRLYDDPLQEDKGAVE